MENFMILIINIYKVYHYFVIIFWKCHWFDISPKLGQLHGWLVVFFITNNPKSNHQQPAIKGLKEIYVFLEANPSEIITIIIEDYVSSPHGLTKVFDAAGLRKFWFPVSRMPKIGENWPTVDDMVRHNQRLVVFTS